MSAAKTACPHPNRLDAAIGYIRRGWRPVPIPLKEKRPTAKGWQALQITEATAPMHFAESGNIGVLDGVGGLTDIDLDCAEAVTAGKYLLPPTGMIFGRDSKPRSHYIYIVSPAAPMEKLSDPTDKKATICEFRCQTKEGGIGLQTVFPPSIHPAGEIVKFACDGEPAQIAESELRIACRRVAAAAVLARNWPAAGEGRHDTMLALAGVLARAEWSQSEALRFCRAVYRAVPTHDVAAVSRIEGEVSHTFKKFAADGHFTGFPTLRNHIRNAPQVIPTITRWLNLESIAGPNPLMLLAVEGEDEQQADELPDDAVAEQESDQSGIELTELGLSLFLVARHSRVLRYASEQKTWLCWNGTHWETDTTQKILRMAIAIVLLEKIKNCKSSSKIAGAIKLAGADQRIASAVDLFDCNNDLLNFRNGTLDLRTGELKPHRRENLITKLIPGDYCPSARAPRWERFLQEVFAPHPELVNWIQRAIGYSLTGNVQEHCFFLMLGNGRNGKGVFINVLKRIFGAYAHQADFRAFEPKHGDGPLDAIANFKGARLIVASESREGAHFDEALMKTLTGGDPVRTRLLHENSFEMAPTWHIWLASNYRPQIRGTDPAVWQRVRLIPFDVSFVGREDRSLPDNLLSESAGIIAWAIEGAMRWREEGLEPLPDAVKMATESYRSESDVMGRFLEDKTETGNQFSAGARDLYHVYSRWANDVGEPVLTETAFGLQLGCRGFQKLRKSTGARYHGVRSKPQ